jgi:hypothetical protein
MSSRSSLAPFDDRDIVNGDVPGGTNTSHTLAIGHLTSLLSAVPKAAGLADYEIAAVEHNVLGRATTEGRRRTFRYLRELYLLDPNRLLFRAMRDLWDEDEQSQPLLAGLSAMARDSVFRASAPGLLALSEGAQVTAEMLTGFVESAFPHAYNEGTAAKIGRNTASSWTQTGHLQGRAAKTRQNVEPRPAALAFALLLGHLQGARGQSLYNTRWTTFFDADVREIEATAGVAGQRGYIELQSGGGIVEIGFRHLLRPMEDLANE